MPLATELLLPDGILMASVSDRRSRLYFKFSYILIALVALVGTVTTFSHEYRSAVMLRGFNADVIESLRGIDSRNLPVTVGGLNELMTECADMILANASLRLNRDLSEDVSASCATAADAIIADNPAFARAHTAALVARATTFTADDYRAAQATAPFEPWPLGTRLLAIERRIVLGGAVDAALDAAGREDVARAVQSRWGRQVLANLYMRRPAIRTAITEAVETRPDEEQAAFLGAVRNLTTR